MLGKIIEIDENSVLLELLIDTSKLPNLINMYVMIEDEDKLVVGEVINLKKNIATINLLGQFVNEKFVIGVINKPSMNSKVKIISKDKIPYIIGLENNGKKQLYLGTSPVYENVKMGVSIDDFFAHHFAIFGSTGSGKSCALARILQNLFQNNLLIPYRSNIFLFDIYGEHVNAFKDINNISPNINFKLYTTDLKALKNQILRIPPWLLTVDDLALLLNVTKKTQLSVIETALKLVSIFKEDEEKVLKHKNHIISKTILDILTSGKPSVQIRDQIFSILTYYNTKNLNLETEIYQPGYIRPLKHCLVIDASGKIREMELLINFFSQFLNENLELNLPNDKFMYTLNDLKNAFDFALISEGTLKSEKIYDEYNSLKIRMETLVKSDYSSYFEYDHYVNKEGFIKDLIITEENKKAQIIDFNLNYVDDRFAKSLTKIYSRILFEYSKDLTNRASIPIHIVLEEAHRYVQNDNDIEILGYNIFERIAKEGRKYAVILGLISQRPSEISSTCLSQCSNFLIFKMIHPNDLDFIKNALTNISENQIKNIKILPPGVCMAFGNAFKIPSFIKFEKPNPLPNSGDAQISNIWFIEK